MRFVLASASQGRYDTLLRAGVRAERIVSGVDEDAITAEGVAELTERLAVAKARAVAAQLDGAALVLGCDSLLEFDGAALGKPGDALVAAERWRSMRGRTGILWTGHCLIDVAAGREQAARVPTEVHFGDLTDAEIDLYVSTAEPTGVAGGFTLDGLGGWFVDAVRGDPHNVVGLSLPLLRTMITEFSYSLTDLNYPTS